MPEETLNPSELFAVLRGFLSDTIHTQSSGHDGYPPTQEELFDLVEERLSATERENLIERIAACLESQEALADILAGIELSATMRTESEIAIEATKAHWLARIHTWFSPPVLVPVLSVCLLLLVALPMLQQPSSRPGSTGEVRSIEPGFFNEETTPTPVQIHGETSPIPTGPTPSPTPIAAGDQIHPATDGAGIGQGK